MIKQGRLVLSEAEQAKRLEKKLKMVLSSEAAHKRNPPQSLPECRALITSDKPATDAQIDAAIQAEFRFAMQRKPNAEELARYRSLMRQLMKEAGKTEGVQATLVAILMCVESIHRMEIGLGPTDEHGRRMLSPQELRYAISYALTDTGTAVTANLTTREQVAETVWQLLDNDRVAKPRLLRFFQEFFEYDRSLLVFKDRGRVEHSHVPQMLVADANLVIQYVLSKDKNVLAELLTTDLNFVAHGGNNEYFVKKWKQIETIRKLWAADQPIPAQLQALAIRIGAARKTGVIPIWHSDGHRYYIGSYNLREDTWGWKPVQPISLPKRAGILTHPAWLSGFSANTRNDVVRRGKWIRERLLAGSVPDVPIDVDAIVPTDPHRTLRDRMQVTRDAACWKCHKMMDPLGLPFEMYNDFGQHRTEEQLGRVSRGRGEKSVPVDSRGQIIDSGDSALDGPVPDAITLVHKLAKSVRVRQSFVRHVFRYFLGRNETLNDSATLIAADKAYVESGGSFKALVASLLTSDSFLYRK